jgi:hypothetical protein
MSETEEHFISALCLPDNDTEFTNALGRFTPCFTEVYALGSAHICAIILCVVRLFYLTRSTLVHPRLSLSHTSKATHVLAMMASVINALIPLMQFNARLGGMETSFTTSTMPPVEAANYFLALVCWALMCAVLAVEYSWGVCRSKSWVVRFSSLFVFAGQCAKSVFSTFAFEKSRLSLNSLHHLSCDIIYTPQIPPLSLSPSSLLYLSLSSLLSSRLAFNFQIPLEHICDCADCISC